MHLGIDLGTTNSSAVVLDDTTFTPVRDTNGGSLIPSVVRIDAKGRVMVGARAYRLLETDPANCRSEFKRLMGTSHRLHFDAADIERSPIELSSEILRAILRMVQTQFGFEAAAAVIGVPALFELPQTSATAEAARLAGLNRVEFIQEPVASALAAGWRGVEDGAWLVYDLGGGTFDVSLLDSREGLLRVVGHDGDNFLGGRDIDLGIVDLVLARLREEGHDADLSDSKLNLSFRRLQRAAEEAKIQLSATVEAPVFVPDLRLGNALVDVDTMLHREELDTLLNPLVDRSLAVCLRLLRAHGMGPGDLGRVVLVGGPTMMPALRQRVAAALDAPLADGFDPMTLVAQGAALFAATADVPARAATAEDSPAEANAWLQYPAVTADPTPFIVGKMLAPGHGMQGVVFERSDGRWTSDVELIDKDDTFAVMVSLELQSACTFVGYGVTSEGTRSPLVCPKVRIVHGLTLSDPPLPRAVGIALANGTVQTFFERGTPLPVRRSFTLRTAQAVAPGDSGAALSIPIVQGEFQRADLCRLVGTLEIEATNLKAPVPFDSSIEVTLHLDRAGGLSASAHIARIDQLFEGVVQLASPNISPEALSKQHETMIERLVALRTRAFAAGLGPVVERLSQLHDDLGILEASARRARGGDHDALESAKRKLQDVDGELSEIEATLAWPELTEELETTYAIAISWISGFGRPEEHDVVVRAYDAAHRSLRAKNATDVERQIALINRVGHAAYFRHPQAWSIELSHCASRLTETADISRAHRLVEEGRAAEKKGDSAGIERAVRGLWRMLPEDAEDQARGFGSGVR